MQSTGKRLGLCLFLFGVSLSLTCGDNIRRTGDDGGMDSGMDAPPGDGGMDAGNDAGMDAGNDAGVDAGNDAGVDAGNDAGVDAGNDAGVDAGNDAGVDAGNDAGVDAGIDAGNDAGADAGVDAGNDAGTDAGTDSGTPLACMGTTLNGIADARAQGDGTTAVQINGAFVTYIKPAIGSLADDPAGFFLQEMNGPALFVAIDPATLTPSPQVGDTVSLCITEMATSNGARRATSVADISRDSMGNDVSALIQDISNETVPLDIASNFEHELIQVTGTLTGTFSGSGPLHQQIRMLTAGITTANDAFRLRIPFLLNSHLVLANNCQVTITTPLWTFTNTMAVTTAQPSMWSRGDLTAVTCPLTTVIRAASFAGSANQVKVVFSRDIDPASINVTGAQFTITRNSDGAPLPVMLASADGNTVTLTTASQVSQDYTVTVANTVTDVFGASISTMMNSAQFAGNLTRAIVRINEVKTNVASGCDLVELRVISGGALEGATLKERLSVVLTFTTFNVATNDLILVHFNSNSATCNPNASTNETTAPDQNPNASFPNNVDTAYDWFSTSTLVASDNVITVLDPAAIMDAVLLTDDPNDADPANDSENSGALVAEAGQWVIPGGGIPVGGFADDRFMSNAAGQLDGLQSIYRNDNDDNNDKDDWSDNDMPSTFGTLNPGQSLLP